MNPGDVVSHTEMCSREGKNLQAGMHFRIAPTHSVLLMSVRIGAPYADSVLEQGAVLIYEGHNEPHRVGGPDPKATDQPLWTGNGTLTQNGRFYMAAEAYRNNELPAERVRVYEKMRSGIWVYNGLFRLVDAWQEPSEGRLVCKFKLTATDEEIVEGLTRHVTELENTRMIPTDVKRTVWKRDGGQCRRCGSADNLHFDHVIPFSKGGSSILADNVQLLCARHNLEKRDRIE
jgi:hypothetical protein